MVNTVYINKILVENILKHYIEEGKKMWKSLLLKKLSFSQVNICRIDYKHLIHLLPTVITEV